MRVEDSALSLDDIEHRILRPIWKDPRVHYVLNCAALGCPELLEQAFTAKNSAMLLIRGSRRFVNHFRAVRIRRGRLYLSTLYRWYADDFGTSDRAIIEHVARFARPRLARRLRKESAFLDGGYDWSLNGAP